MAEFVKIEGLDVFTKALKALPQKVADKLLRRATLAGAKIIRAEAKLQAPEYEGMIGQSHPPRGTLKRAISVGRSRRNSGPGKEVANVFVRQAKNGRVGQKGVKAYGKFDAFYARFVEFGTSKMSARSFLRPAFELKKRDAVDAIGESIAAGFPQEAAKLGLRFVKYK